MPRANSVPVEGERVGGNDVVVRLPQKARAMDEALRFVAAGELLPQDMSVLWFICTSIDNQTGETKRRYKTIADSCGVSRATAVRAIARLKACGLIKIRERYYNDGPGKLATAFQLGNIPRGKVQQEQSFQEPVTQCHPLREDVGPQVNQGSVQECTGNVVSHLSRNPIGRPGQEIEDHETNWGEIETWFAKAGRYVASWGYGAENAAADDLKRLRLEKGEARLLRAIEKVKTLGLYGENLIDFLEKTYSGGAERGQ